MTTVSRNSLQQSFENGDIPTAQDFINIFDSFIHQQEDGVTLKELSGSKALGLGTVLPEEILHLKAHSAMAGEGIGIRIENAASQNNHGWSIVHISDPGSTSPDGTDGSLSILAKPQSGNPVERANILNDGTLTVKGPVTIGNNANSSPAFGTISYSDTPHSGSGTPDIEVFMEDASGGQGVWVSLTAVGGSGGGGTVTTVNGQGPDQNGNVVIGQSNISGLVNDITTLTSGLATKASSSDLTSGLAGKASTSDLSTGLAGKANIAPEPRHGASSIQFDKDAEYGTDDAPESVTTIDANESSANI